ncbi:MAG: class I SAM-dependent methyltransferase [Nanoarchaeota archaeon]
MSHYYDAHPEGPFRTSKITVTLKGRTIELYSSSGLFSIKHVDRATELLVEHMQVPAEARVLDLGCGYGVVGLAVKLLYPETEVVLTDINPRAVKVSRQNAKLHGVELDIRHGNIYATVEGEQFNVILTNPPYVAGRKVCYAFIDGAYEHLRAGGTLQLVARHAKGGKMLEKRMQERFGNVTTLAKGSGFRVYISEKTA